MVDLEKRKEEKSLNHGCSTIAELVFYFLSIGGLLILKKVIGVCFLGLIYIVGVSGNLGKRLLSCLLD